MKVEMKDYLFLQFKRIVVPLEEICSVYYPHLRKKIILEKARMQDFPFPCFKMDDSQKAPYFANIYDVAEVLEQVRDKQSIEHSKLHN